ncbi:uncharacterized protein N7529_009058 [Penicillium soppii]|uniref:uncharacterized protein n=1 Tax=Penicillium soppii TaxID=69789 RepID=UPI0025481D38|nr:uncharacterized protein N7529_009058 [Penicillium soppii]KAJ5861748.1 hypothetical protein N7529_009058 [Penicillium soppii]
MSVFTIVHRAIPPLPWKRRTSLKGKSHLKVHEIEISEKNDIPEPTPESDSEPSMHRDVYKTVQIAVRNDAREDPIRSQSAPPTPENKPNPDSASAPESRASSSAAPTRAQLTRAVSWASIVRSRDRWTVEQERELVHAQRQLERCQKAWSSEQEVWLAYVRSLFVSFGAACLLFVSMELFDAVHFKTNPAYTCKIGYIETNVILLTQVEALTEEKESHTDFLSARHRQQGEEQHQFRKAWRRRRSSGEEEVQQNAIETANRLGKLRRLQRYGYSGQRLGAGSTALAVKG